MAKKKVQVLVHDDKGSNANLRSLLEDHGFSVVAAPERKSPRYREHPRRKGPPGASDGRNAGTGPDTVSQDFYEGTVKLVVVSDQNVRKMVHFVDQLRQNPGFRLLFMEAAERKNAVNIMLGLREPTAMGPALAAMAEVFKVEVPADPAVESFEPVLQVILW